MDRLEEGGIVKGIDADVHSTVGGRLGGGRGHGVIRLTTALISERKEGRKTLPLPSSIEIEVNEEREDYATSQ